MNDDIYLGNLTDIELQQIMDKINNNIRTYMNKTDITINNPSLVNPTTPMFAPQQTNILPTREQLSMNYNTLLNGKVDDEDMRRNTIKYAELMMQERTWCRIQVHTDKGQIGEMKVICCLPEHGQAFVNWWYGKDIPSREFERMCQKFQTAMKGNRIATVVPKISAIGVIKEVTTTFYMG